MQQQLDSGATATASKWLDHWLGRLFAFLANSFFLLEMTAAVEVYGGGERLISVLQADTIEAHYLSAWNTVLRGERGRALQHFDHSMSTKVTIEVDEQTADVLQTRAAELGVTVSELVAELATLESEPITVAPDEIAGLDRRWKKIEARGSAVPQERVGRWLRTWGTPRYRPWPAQ